MRPVVDAWCVPLSPAYEALLRGDLEAASQACGVALPAAFLDDAWLWRLRLGQVRADPTAVAWTVRALAVAPDGEVVGHAGFHGPPQDGTVEVGYSVVAQRRGRGYAHATLAALVAEAAAHPDVRTVRATVSPDNAASLAVVRAAGFAHTGEQVDPEDGLELVFELAVGAA